MGFVVSGKGTSRGVSRCAICRAGEAWGWGAQFFCLLFSSQSIMGQMLVCEQAFFSSAFNQLYPLVCLLSSSVSSLLKGVEIFILHLTEMGSRMMCRQWYAAPAAVMEAIWSLVLGRRAWCWGSREEWIWVQSCMNILKAKLGRAVWPVYFLQLIVLFCNMLKYIFSSLFVFRL